MKAIQIMMDEGLLRRLDADPDVQREGRSAVLRRAADEWLRRRREAEIAAAYRRGYAEHPPDEFEHWGDAGTWPED